MQNYCVFFLEESGGVIGCHDFDAPSDPLATAVLLSDACSDVCDGFQVWHGQRRIASLWPMNGASESIAARMNDNARKTAEDTRVTFLKRDSGSQKVRTIGSGKRTNAANTHPNIDGLARQFLKAS